MNEVNITPKAEMPEFLKSWLKQARNLLLVILTIFIGFNVVMFSLNPGIMSKAFESSWNYMFEYTSPMRALKSRIKDMEGSYSKAAIERLTVLKNHSMDGIEVLEFDKTVLVYNASIRDTEYEAAMVGISSYANEAGYDGVLFGRIHRGIDGVVVFADHRGRNETDLGLILALMEQRGCDNVLAIVDNPTSVYVGYPVNDNMTTGNVSIDVSKELWPLSWGHKRVKVKADNFYINVSSTGLWKGEFKDNEQSGRDNRYETLFAEIGITEK